MRLCSRLVSIPESDGKPVCALQKQTLMQHVLRCDYEACRQYLVNLEQAFLLDQGSQALGALLDHRCDGNRNILHAAVSVCFPVSNKETKEEEGKLVNQDGSGPHFFSVSSRFFPSQIFQHTVLIPRPLLFIILTACSSGDSSTC